MRQKQLFILSIVSFAVAIAAGTLGATTLALACFVVAAVCIVAVIVLDPTSESGRGSDSRDASGVDEHSGSDATVGSGATDPAGATAGADASAPPQHAPGIGDVASTAPDGSQAASAPEIAHCVGCGATIPSDETHCESCSVGGAFRK